MIYRIMLISACFYLLLCSSFVHASDATPEGQLGPSYKGWLWFEDKELEKKVKQRKNSMTPVEAMKSNEELKLKMEEKRNVMIANPTPETVRDYTEMEKVMWERAFALEKAYNEAKFKYPEIFDKSENPVNVHAVKFKRSQEQQKLAIKIKSFAKDFELVVFTKAGCPYCKEFAPILKNFGIQYGFDIEEVTINGELTGEFSGRAMPSLAKQLKIEVFPTVVAVSNDGKTAFELIRGYVSIPELEEYVSLAKDYIDSEHRKKTERAHENK